MENYSFDPFWGLAQSYDTENVGSASDDYQSISQIIQKLNGRYLLLFAPMFKPNGLMVLHALAQLW